MATVEVLNRKPARRMSEIPVPVIQAINRGETETLNLMEFLVVNHTALASHVLQQMGYEDESVGVERNMQKYRVLSGMQAMRKVSDVIAEISDRTGNFESIRRAMMQHPSDMVRNYAAYLTGKMNWPDVADALEAVKMFAADKNAGTREIAFYVIRHRIINETRGAIETLRNWVTDVDANVRRFAVESTRPRGVWVSHIPSLKEDPTPGFPLVRALITDDSRYVQNSVANWMNDASKTHPQRVVQECSEWIRTSGENKATSYIVRRALRTVSKVNKV